MRHKIFVDGFVLRFPRTGVVNYAYNIINELNKKSNCDIEILIHDLGFADPLLENFAKSLPYRTVGETEFERRQRGLLGKVWHVPGLLLPLPGVTTRHTDPCDVYHCTDVYYYPSAHAHKNVIMVHDLTTTLYPETHEPLNIEKERQKLMALQDFDEIVVNSNATKTDIVKFCGIDEKKITTLYLGADSIYENPNFVIRRELTDRLGIPRNRPYLLSVSTIEPRKNIVGTLEAFRLFCERNPTFNDIILVMAGHHGWNNDSLNRYFSTYPHQDRVYFTGFVPSELMASLYRYAEIFIYLSFYEGFGLPILEAMKSSAPVICSNTSSMPEVIGDCGTLVSPGSPEEACVAIERLLGDSELAGVHRERGLARSRAFTWGAHADQLLEVFGIDAPEAVSATSTHRNDRSRGDGEGAAGKALDVERYATLLRTERRQDQAQRKGRLEHIQLMSVRPQFYVLIAGDDKDAIEQTRQSCETQLYPPMRIVRRFGEIGKVKGAADYFVILNAGDILHQRALYECAARINVDPEVEMIYFDEDHLDASGNRYRPFFKPDWSPDFLEAVNYIGSAACYALPLALNAIRDAAGQYDFTLRVTEMARNIVHLRQILLHRQSELDAPRPESVTKEDMNALAQRLKRTGRQGRIEPIGTPRGGYRINPVLARRPLVSIVIPTAAKSVMIEGKKRDLIAACVKSIVDKSTYRNIEFIIVDNGDLAPERLSHAKDVPVRCVTYLDRQLNISKKMNMGAACAAGEFLLLLNDDTEIISPDWIERLLFHFEKPHAGLVGGKLLYPDKTIQHAGVVVVHGHPDHVSRGEPRDFDGYFFSGCAVRNYQAVTGAMSLIPASLYRNLGGYEEHMPLTFNDIDLSMKVWDAGYTVIFDPDVELFHFEGKSATNSYNFDDRDSFYGRWGRSPLDRFYNEYYLSIGPAEYRFKENVRFI